MTILQSHGLAGDEIAASVFGGNILAPRGEMTGDGSYAELIQDLGVTSLRYPGGSLTEEFFDLTNPDAVTATHRDTGEVIDFIPISEFMQAAAELGSSVTIVLPTRHQLSATTDGNGDRFAAVDEDVLRGFVRDVVSGRYGDAQIEAFEIGNEYWGSGRMSAQEYGRVAADMSRIIDSELTRLGAEANTDVVVQMGANFNFSSLDERYEGWRGEDIENDLEARYGIELEPDVVRASGRVDWTEVNNEILRSNFEDGAIQYVDGIVTHVYSKEPALPGQRSFMLDMIDDAWHEHHEGLDTYVTEWNVSGSTGRFDRGEDYGLYQAHEMLNIVEQFAKSGVDVAHAWPLLQNTANTFSHGFEHKALTPPGEFFETMSQTLPGKRMLDLDPRSGETEIAVDGASVHAFYGDGDLVLFVAAPRTGAPDVWLDLSGLIVGEGGTQAELLGVAAGDVAGNTRATAVKTQLEPDSVWSDGVLSTSLNPGEILTLTLTDIRATDAFAADLGVHPGMMGSSAQGTHTILLMEPNAPPVQLEGGVPGDAPARGSDAQDWVEGGRGDDFIKGHEADDTIDGGRGDDVLNGGRGNDVLTGSQGHDQVRGREGHDDLSGGEGNDTLFGERGHDFLKGAEGHDFLYGGDGDDTLHGGQKGDFLDAGIGDNVVTGGFGRDTISFGEDDRAFTTRITDFTPGRDALWIDEDLLDDLDDIRFLHDAQENTLTLLLNEEGTQRIVLDDTGPDELEEDVDLMLV